MFWHCTLASTALSCTARAPAVTFARGSDIDLTLDAPGLTLSDLLCISGELDDLMLPYTIDLSLLRHIKNLGLLRHIERVGKPL